MFDKPLACATCGSDSELWAWYPDDTRQTIEGHVGPDGTASYDYTGIIDSGEAGEDNGFLCGNCSTLADTIEELCGLPPNVPALEARLQAALGEVAVLERKLREAKGE
jgi:hypothetical protein